MGKEFSNGTIDFSSDFSSHCVCRARYWLNIDCCGLFTAGFTWLLIVFGMVRWYACFSIIIIFNFNPFHDFVPQITTSKIVILPWFGWSCVGITHLMLFNTISVLAFISHIQSKKHIYKKNLYSYTLWSHRNLSNMM